MDWLEQELKRALERKDPSPGFAERVTAAAARPRVLESRRFFEPQRWLPVAAALVALAGVSDLAYRRHQGMVAKEQVMLAMRITADRLNHVQMHLREVQP